MLGNLRIGSASAVSVVVAAGLSFAVAISERSGAREPATPVAPLISSGETVAGEQIVYPTGAPARVTAAVVVLAPGEETGWHTHNVPVVGYVLEGVLQVDYGEKGVRVYRAGDAMLEAMHIAHNGRNIGSGPMRILAVFVGADGIAPTKPITR
jgi:quercetin dioxygenase-like cupin family protein